MMRLNRNAAKLMGRFGANGATDITGFGLLGHASNLAAVQKAEIHRDPQDAYHQARRTMP